MATIIQNLACLEVKLQGNSGRAYFDEDILHGKTIRNLWALFSAEDKALYSPFSVPGGEIQLSSIDDIDEEFGIYLNVIDTYGSEAVRNLSIHEMLLHAESASYEPEFSELVIGRKMDSKKSFFNFFLPEQDNNIGEVKFLLYVSYDTKPHSIDSFTIKNSFTANIPIPDDAEIADIRLSDYIPREYRSRRIKQIVFPNPETSCFLDLKADNAYIENIPSVLLYNYATTKNIFFDNIKIDYEESFLRYRNTRQETDIKETITFLF